MIVQKRPAKESAMMAPARGVKLEMAEKLERVLEAGTSAMFITFVK